MSLEQTIEANTVAMTALTAALLGKGAAGVTAGTTRPPKVTTGAAAEPKHTFEEVTTICVRVKSEKGEKAAQELIAGVGGAPKLKDVPKANFDALFAAAEAILAADDDL